MAQQKEAGGKPAARGADRDKANARDKTASGKAGSAAPGQSAERYTVKPEFWDNLLDSLPPWGDEIAAIILIVFGVVSFLSLLNVSSDATISNAWSTALTSLFGYGSAIVSFAIFGLGVIILLPKLGIVIRFPTRRILALEFAFLAALALLHLASGETEMRSLARLGRGGGQVGWALSTLVSTLVGAPIAGLIWAIVLLVALGIAVGADRDLVIRTLTTSEQRLRELGLRLRPPTPANSGNKGLGMLDEALAPKPIVIVEHGGAPVLARPNAANVQRVRAYSITRIRPNPANLPPSMRPGAAPPAPNEAPAPTSPAQPFIRKEEPPLPDFNAVGTIVKGKRSKSEPLMVERPDGRLKRYFAVEGLKEQRATPRRDSALPPLELLRDLELSLPDEQEINNNVVLIENTLLEFDIDIDVVDVKVGPTVTQYAVQPFREVANGEGETTFNRTRISKIASLANDLALALSARRLRLETPVPGQSYIGIEVPNKNPSVVALRSVYESKAYQDKAQKKKSPLYIPLGRDVAGVPVGVDLAQMPHLLIAGTTGSGKSVCIAAIATSLILENTPDLVKLVMLDPKMVELSRFNGLPHLLGPVETDQERIIGVLRWCTREMERRYKVLEEHSARNIDIYNSKLGRRRREDYMPYIVILIDEVGDLMMSHPDETEKTITRLAQMARAVGMHLIVATQRPSVDVITGLIKANFPSRISFAVASGVDSRVILDSVGAETLMGRGDMLFHASDAAGPRRIQGCYVSDDEVRTIVDYWKQWSQEAVEDGKLEPIVNGPWERGLTRREVLSETDPMLEQAIALITAEGEASASMIQRRLGIGYPRAARIMDLLLELGIVGEFKSNGRSREVLIKPGSDPFKDLIDKRMNSGQDPELDA